MDYLGQSRYVGILEYVYEGITFYFIDNESYFWGDKHMVIGITTWKILIFLTGSVIRTSCDRMETGCDPLP